MAKIELTAHISGWCGSVTVDPSDDLQDIARQLQEALDAANARDPLPIGGHFSEAEIRADRERLIAAADGEGPTQDHAKNHACSVAYNSYRESCLAVRAKRKPKVDVT